MSTLKTKINGIAIEIQRGFYVIESNKGNHSGINRTWKQWNRSYATRQDARRDMAHEANMANDVLPGQQGYTRIADNGAWVDGASYAVVNHRELLEMIAGTGTNLANIHCITVIGNVEA